MNCIVVSKSYIENLLVAQSITQAPGVQILTIQPLPNSEHLIVAQIENDKSEKLRSIISQFSTSSYYELTGPSQIILDTYFGLNKNLATESILFAENKSVYDCFRALDFVLAKNELRLIEFKSGRGIGGTPFFALSGPIQSLKEIQDQFKMSFPNISCAVIETPSDFIKSLYA